MDIQFDNVSDRLKYGVRDFTSVGPKKSFTIPVMTDEYLYKMNAPLYSFYMQLLDSLQDPNSKVLDNVLSVETKTRFQREQMLDRLQAISKNLRYLKTQQPTDLEKTVQNIVKESPILSLMGVETNPQAGGTTQPGQSGGVDDVEPKITYYSEKLEDLKNVKDDNKEERVRLLGEIENNPIFNPHFEAISMTDRVTFIALTFIIRGIVLFFVDWGIYNHMINSFNAAFMYYIFIYVAVFILWLMLVNSGSGKENDTLFFKLIFYYMNTSAHGIGRVMVHLLVQLMLIPIPFVVKDRMSSNNDAVWNYDHRRSAYRVLSTFTFYTWLLTSIIALRY